MSAADDAYQRLIAAQRAAALMTDAERAEITKAEERARERHRIRSRLWKPF